MLFVLSIWAYDGIDLLGYEYPMWSLGIGWAITLSSIVCIPIYMVHMFFTTEGTFRQVSIQIFYLTALIWMYHTKYTNIVYIYSHTHSVFGYDSKHRTAMLTYIITARVSKYIAIYFMMELICFLCAFQRIRRMITPNNDIHGPGARLNGQCTTDTYEFKQTNDVIDQSQKLNTSAPYLKAITHNGSSLSQTCSSDIFWEHIHLNL